jgi:glycosyltransferase involved in cell wall biosynthesis
VPGRSRAVEIARRVGLPLKVAAKVDAADRDYHRREVEPLFRDHLVEFVGEIGEHDKGEFLGNALALLFPIDWPEPFGLVMIEAMACGTPVIAWRRGSVSEVIDEGVTGFVVEDLDGAVRAVAEAAALDRRRCRQAFERRYGVARMAEDYLRVYRRVIDGAAGRPPAARVPRAVAADGRPDGANGSPRPRVRPEV